MADAELVIATPANRRPDEGNHMDTAAYVIFAIAIITVGWLAYTEACKKK